MDVKSTFEANPGVEVLYGFEDGNAFINQADADRHKKSTGKDYKTITKEKPQPKK